MSDVVLVTTGDGAFSARVNDCTRIVASGGVAIALMSSGRPLRARDIGDRRCCIRVDLEVTGYARDDGYE